MPGIAPSGGAMSSLPIHPTEEVLEEFYFGRLQSIHVDQVEEHLLWCIECQERYSRVEQFVRDVKASPAPPPGSRRSRTSFSFAFGPAMAACALVVCAVGLWFALAAQRGATLAEATLASDRGERAAGVVQVPRARHTRLRLDTSGIDLPPQLEIQVVSASGEVVWRQLADRPVVDIAQQLPEGQYFVRLNTAGGEPLREYVLAVKP